jgi:hydrophobic/amphiphilic exporter-1 (mainly G- bacteria), HAE1 family
MRLVEFSLSRRVTVSMIAVAVVLFGLVSFGRLPVSLLPDLSYPSLTVETRYDGAAPAEVESLVTRPVEEVVGVVTGVRRLTSSSRPGLSQVVLEFGWGRDMDFAALDVRQKLDLLSLPRDSARPVLLRFDPSNEPVLRLYLTGAESSTALRYVAEEVLKKDLESTEGVAAIKVNGGAEEEIEVRVDESKLARMGLSIEDVGRRLLSENVNEAGGSLYESEARYLVRAVNELSGSEDILSTIIATRDGRNVALGEVATVTRGTRRQDVRAGFDGAEAVELAIYKEGDANTVTVARAVENRLAALADEIPEGIAIHHGADQSRFIQASIDEVLSNALVGGLIAMLVLLLFLKNLRSTLIIGLTIPISIVATFFLMVRTGTSLNVMSLGGLALGVGMLVDNAIVVLEAIFKRHEAGASWSRASLEGASEVGRAVTASTLTTIAVFVPVVFLEGVAAQLFRDMALTVSFSLVASLAVALTLIPMLTALAGRGEDILRDSAPPSPAGRLRRGARAVLITAPGRGLAAVRWLLAGVGRSLAWLTRPASRAFDGGIRLLADAYPRALRWSLANRNLVLASVVTLFAGAVALVPRLGFDLIPAFSQGEFGFRVELPEGTPLDVTDRTVSELARSLDGDSRIGSYATLAGGKGFALTTTGSEGENVARIQVRMAPGASAADETVVADRLRGRLAAAPAVSRFEMERPTVFTFRPPIEVEVYADDLATLHRAAATIESALDDVAGLVDVESSAALGNPELQVRFLRQPLARLGLDLAQVAGDGAQQGAGRGGDAADRGRPRDRRRRPRPPRRRGLARRRARPDRRAPRRRADLPQVGGRGRARRRAGRDPAHRPEAGGGGLRQPRRPRHGRGRRRRARRARRARPAGLGRPPALRPGGGAGPLARRPPLRHGPGDLPRLPGDGLAVRVASSTRSW